MNRFKLRIWDPVLNKGAIWTYWEGAYRDTGRDEGATIVLQTRTASRAGSGTSRCTTTRVSVGVVAPFDYLFQGRAATTSRSTPRRSTTARLSRNACRSGSA